MSSFVCNFQSFAGEGLRTLVLAAKELDPGFFEAWKKRHLEASVSLDNREERLDAVYEEIETNLTLVGELTDIH